MGLYTATPKPCLRGNLQFRELIASFVSFSAKFIKMTRGNQRELARAKAAKKQGGGTKASETEANKGLTAQQRKERDADRMREKQAAKEAAKAAGGESSGGKKK